MALSCRSPPFLAFSQMFLFLALMWTLIFWAKVNFVLLLALREFRNNNRIKLERLPRGGFRIVRRWFLLISLHIFISNWLIIDVNCPWLNLSCWHFQIQVGGIRLQHCWGDPRGVQVRLALILELINILCFGNLNRLMIYIVFSG